MIMMLLTPAPLVGLLPTVFLAAQSGVEGDPWGFATQLGIGGVLVGFAVWLQDRFSTAARKEIVEMRAEMKTLIVSHLQALDIERVRHDVELHTEMDRHDVTRAALIAALTKRDSP